MLDLFDTRYSTDPSTTTPPKFPELQQRLRDDTDIVMQYLREERTALHNGHRLVRLIGSLPIDAEASFLEMIHQVERSADMTARMNDITTPSRSHGIELEGSLYGEDTHESWILVDTISNHLEALDDWQSLRPIRIYRHPVSSLVIPRWDRPERHSGFAVIGIDLVALAIQYYAWRQNQDPTAVTTSNVNQFLLAYPIANAIPEHVDRCILNRFVATMRGEPLFEEDNDWYSRMQQPYRLLDDYIDDRLQKFHRKKEQYEIMLHDLPLAFHDTAFDITRNPPMLKTRNNEWALWWIQMPILHALLYIDYHRGGSRSRREHRDISRKLQEINQQKDLDLLIGPAHHFEFQHDLENRIAAYLETAAD